MNVNAVAFGFVETRLTAASDESDETMVQVRMRSARDPREDAQMAPVIIPLGRPASPEDAAGPIFFLCSPW